MWDTQIKFWANVEKTDTCWNWLGPITNGYGRFNLYTGKQVYAHRQAYIWEHERVPEGLVIDHLCRNTRCVRPDHLEAVTQAENVKRGKRGDLYEYRTHCVHGHEYSPENKSVSKDGRRYCKECWRIRSRKYYHQRKARRAEQGQ